VAKGAGGSTEAKVSSLATACWERGLCISVYIICVRTTQYDVEVASWRFRQAVRVADGKGFGTGKMPGRLREGFVDRS
jgi:hypothetical protein